MRALPLVALALLGLLAGLWLAKGERAWKPATPPVAALAAPHDSEPELETAREVASAPAVEPAIGLTARAFLDEYYGERWPEIRAKMEGAGAKLDVPYTPHPWAEVEPLLRQQAVLEESHRTQLIKDRAHWTDTLTNAWLRTEFPGGGRFELTASELDELEQRIAPEMQEFEAAGNAYCDQLDFHLRSCWEQGRYKRAPYTDVGLNDEYGFYAKGIAGYGWVVAIVLQDADYPDMVALEKDMRAIVERRDARVLEFLRAHRAR
jgi:hypothetical protein